MPSKMFSLTPAAGKRLIAKALLRHRAVQTALASGTLVIIAGTTNGCIAEEILGSLGLGGDFSRRRFFRGVTTPPRAPTTTAGRLPDESKFPGDVILRKGRWQQGATIFDVADELQPGDLILKGANALDRTRAQAAVLVGDPKAGTIGVILQAVVGRRVGLIVPVGLEKRVDADLHQLALKINAPGGQGPRLMPVPGEVFTEIDALALLTGTAAALAAAGGVSGAEGGVWLAVEGTEGQLQSAEAVISSVALEPAFEIG